MSSNLEAFTEIVQGQMPDLAQRTKMALDDPDIQDMFRAAEVVNSMEYLYFVNLVAQRYNLFFDECEEVYRRLADRSRQEEFNG